MKIIKPSVELILDSDIQKMLKKIERCGRICYQSKKRTTDYSFSTFIKSIIKRGHLSVIEHGSITIDITCDLGVSHELVRHRIGSYSQESTRYVNYQDGLTFIKPCYLEENTDLYEAWKFSMQSAEDTYKAMRSMGAKPEEARAVLPKSVKTEIGVTYNFRQWRHFLETRGVKGAHPQFIEIAILVLKELQKHVPIIFSDYVIDNGYIKKI